MEETKFVCPVCRISRALVLKKPESVVLMTCPGCAAILLVYRGLTFKIDKSEIRNLTRERNLKKGHALLEIISQSKKAGRTVPKVVHFRPKRIGKPRKIERLLPISKEEVLNLIIDINTSHSIEEFLHKLED